MAKINFNGTKDGTASLGITDTTKQLAREDVGRTVAPWESADYSGKEEGKVHLDKPDTINYSRSATISGGSAYEPIQVDKVASHDYSQYTFGQVTEGPHSHTTAPCGPLQVDKVAHHSYSKCTFGQATEGGQDGEYAPLDVTTLQDTAYTVPAPVETSDEAYEYANSMFDDEYDDLEDPTSQKAELHESKTGMTASEHGAATDAPHTGYANSRFEDNHRDDSKTNKKYFTIRTWKESMTHTPPTAAKKPGRQSGRKSAAASQVNIVMKPKNPVVPFVTSEVDLQSTRVPLRLSAKTTPEATAQDSKDKKVLKPATDEKGGKKPILPKHVTAVNATPLSSPKGKALASTSLQFSRKGKPPTSPDSPQLSPKEGTPSLAAKKAPAKKRESIATGKVSVAELARRLEKGKHNNG